jgi:hypothetical protein
LTYFCAKGIKKAGIRSFLKKKPTTFRNAKNVIQSYLNEFYCTKNKQDKTNQAYLSMAMGLLMVTVAFDKSA